MGGSAALAVKLGGDSQRERLLWALIFGKDPLGDIARELGVKADREEVYGALHGTKPPGDGTAPDLGKLEGFADALDAILNGFGSQLGDVDSDGSGKGKSRGFYWEAGGRQYNVISQGHGRTEIQEHWTDQEGHSHDVTMVRQSGHDAQISHTEFWTDSDGVHTGTDHSDGSWETTDVHPDGSRREEQQTANHTVTVFVREKNGTETWTRTAPDGTETHGTGRPPHVSSGTQHQSGDGEGSDTGAVNPIDQRLAQAARPQKIPRPPSDDSTDGDLDPRPDAVRNFIHLDPCWAHSRWAGIARRPGRPEFRWARSAAGDPGN